MKHRTKRGRRIRQGRRAGARRTRLKSDRLGLNHVRIIYWNCSSVLQRRPVLDRLVYTADIVVLQETRLGDKGTFNLAGFDTFYNRRHQGQAILVRESLKAREVDVTWWNCDEIQLHAVSIRNLPQPFVLVNVYACNDRVNAQKWQCLRDINDQRRIVIFCGDFNAKGTLWGNTSTNTQGEELENALITTDLLCINDGNMIRMASQPEHEDSVIDLALVSPTLIPTCRFAVLGCHGSDHYPCVILVAKDRTRKQRQKINSFRYDHKGSDIVAKIRMDKCRSHIGRKKSWEQPPWWNEELEKAWVEKRHATAKWQKAKKTMPAQPDLILLLKQGKDDKVGQFKTLATEAKAAKWDEFCCRVATEKSLKLFWRLHKTMNGPAKFKGIANFQSADMTWQKNDEDKGKAFLAHFLA